MRQLPGLPLWGLSVVCASGSSHAEAAQEPELQPSRQPEPLHPAAGDLPAGERPEVLPVEEDLPGCASANPAETLEEGRLATSVRSEDEEDLPLLDSQRDAAQDLLAFPVREPDPCRLKPHCASPFRRRKTRRTARNAGTPTIPVRTNRKKVPLVPMGGGLVLSGLSRPLKGGIVLDMKRMNRILEVNEMSRYAVVEAGASQGMLQAYLKKNHPTLKHSVPDSPPMATIGGNVLIHGSGHLSHAAGFHSDMLNGMEVVLPTGEVAKIGSCSTSPYWFGRAPLPDLAGLFLGWFGTTGVVTKLAIKLYPNRPYQDVGVFVTQDPGLIKPGTLYLNFDQTT